MAINVDISKITGINQVGNSYQRKSAVPLDYYSLFNTKAEAEAYAASNPVSYVGQVISYIDNNEVKVCVIADAAGALKEVGKAPLAGSGISVSANGEISVNVDDSTIKIVDNKLTAIIPEVEIPEYTGDSKTIEVSSDKAISLLGAAAAAAGTLPMLEEVEVEGEKVTQLVWKTLEQIGAGDGNDNTTYVFEYKTDEQKLYITTKENGVEKADKQTIDLSAFVTANELTEALNQLPEDKNTTYSLTQEGMVLTLTPSEGDADTVTIDAYTKKEIDDKFSALPEDQDTTYSVKDGEKALKLEGTEFSTVLGLTYTNNRISLTGIDGEEIAGFDASAFVADGVLEDVSYNTETKDLTFTWNILGEDGNKKTDIVNIADLIDTYTAGNGLKLENAEFSVKLAEGNESFLTVDTNGVKLSGVQEAINTAKQDAIDAAAEAAKKYESKAEASAVYTKEEANNLLSAKADASAVYTKDEANGLLNAKADASAVYTKEAADELLNAKANSADVYTKTAADELLGVKANSADVERDYAKKATTLAGYGIADAYTATQTDEAIAAKIKEMTGGESAADVLSDLKDYIKANDREIYGDTYVTEHTVEGVYTPDYSVASRIDTAEIKLQGIEAGAQVNVIESVAKKDSDCRIEVTTTGKAVVIDDANLRTDIANAKKAGTDAAGVASEAVAAASQNAQAIQTNTADIGGLKTLTGEHVNKIAALEQANTTHAGQFTALSGTVQQHGIDIANLQSGKADTSVTEGLSGRITINENAIKAINETTIPAINSEIAKKADSETVNSALDTKLNKGGYTDEGQSNAILFINEEGNIDFGVDIGGIADIEYLEQRLSETAEDIYTSADLTYATKEELKTTDDLAKATEAKLSAFLGAVTDPDATQGVIDTLEEIQKYMTEDTSAFTELSKEVDANTKSIADNKAELENKIGSLEYEDSTSAESLREYTDTRLEEHKAYIDTLSAACHTVDDKTIKLREEEHVPYPVAYVAEVSTDILTQGTQTLILCAGTASTVI